MSESIDRTPPGAPSADVPRVGRGEPVGPRARRREPRQRDPEDPRRAPSADPTPESDDEPGKGGTLDVRV